MGRFLTDRILYKIGLISPKLQYWLMHNSRNDSFLQGAKTYQILQSPGRKHAFVEFQVFLWEKEFSLTNIVENCHFSKKSFIVILIFGPHNFCIYNKNRSWRRILASLGRGIQLVYFLLFRINWAVETRSSSTISVSSLEPRDDMELDKHEAAYLWLSVCLFFANNLLCLERVDCSVRFSNLCYIFFFGGRQITFSF